MYTNTHTHTQSHTHTHMSRSMIRQRSTASEASAKPIFDCRTPCSQTSLPEWIKSDSTLNKRDKAFYLWWQEPLFLHEDIKFTFLGLFYTNHRIRIKTAMLVSLIYYTISHFLVPLSGLLNIYSFFLKQWMKVTLKAAGTQFLFKQKKKILTLVDLSARTSQKINKTRNKKQINKQNKPTTKVGLYTSR